MTSLFDPVTVGAIDCANRIFMAPLTRQRATRGHVPTPLMADYYAQRASAGLIIAEAAGVSREGWSWATGPALWTAEQTEGWRQVTEAIHAQGGRVIAQILHMGRLVHSSMTGLQPVSSSATIAQQLIHTDAGKVDPEPARAMTRDDISRIVEDHAIAARNAMAAEFDGVQIHAANGYLIDEFLRDNSNFRTDEYGGVPENRIRFLREVTEAVSVEIGAERTAVRLSPNGDVQGCFDSDPERVFVPAAAMLDALGIAFLEIRELRAEGTFRTSDQPPIHDAIRKVFRRPLVLNQDYGRTDAIEAVSSGLADAVAFGRPFIANPDLPRRLREQQTLAKDEVATWYSGGANGYTDYPALDDGAVVS